MPALMIDLDPRAVMLNVQASSKVELFKLMVDSLIKTGLVTTPTEVIKAITLREDTRPTGLALGVACPHAKCSGVQKTCLAVARLAKPMDFGSTDGVPARHVFLILAPSDSSDSPHIKVLASIVSCYRNPALLALLDQAPDTQAYHTLLTGCHDEDPK